MLAISLFWLGVALIALAILMLFWDSFKQHKLWGLAGLILLVPLVVHMFLNWSELNVRKAFYILVLGSLSLVVSIAGGALTQLPFLAEHEVVQVLKEKNIAPSKEAPLPNQEQADAAALAVEENYDPLLTGSEYETLETKEIVPEDINKVHPKTTAARYETITEDERVLAINKWIRLTMIDGKTVEGRLTNVLDEAVLVESSVDGGVLGFSYSNNEIKTMAVRLEAGEQLAKPEVEAASVESESVVEEISTDIQNEVQQTNSAPEAITEPLQQPVIDTPATVDDVQTEVEVIKPEMEILEPTMEEQPANDALEAIEEIVDDSKSTQNPVGQ